jgi:hypothetical protein
MSNNPKRKNENNFLMENNHKMSINEVEEEERGE